MSKSINDLTFVDFQRHRGKPNKTGPTTLGVRGTRGRSFDIDDDDVPIKYFDADGVGVIDLGELKKHPEIEEVFEDDYTTDDDFALRGRQGYGKIPHVIETREDQGSAQELPAFDDYDPDQMD